MSEESQQRWLPIESNPDVMNKFLHSCGLRKDQWAVTDVFGLDETLLAMLPQPVLSLMLLFPINVRYTEYCNEMAKSMKTSKHETSKDLYYMKQTIGNACGTVAMIHAVANNRDRINLNDDSALKKFLDSTMNKTPLERAVALEEDDRICAIHDQVAKEGQTSAPNLEDKVDYHYVAFVENGGNLYELDGRKDSPINLGPTKKEDFLAKSVKACQEYMKRDPENLNFVIVALAAVE